MKQDIMQFTQVYPTSVLPKSFSTAASQRGVSLPIVLIFLLLAIISVLGAFRAGFLNEKMVGNESDYNRAFAAAEALMRDAEMDIRGRRPPYDLIHPDGRVGFPCRPTTDDGNTTELTSKAGYEDSCRLRGGATPWFPLSNAEFDEVENILVATGGANRCSAGICMPQNMTDLESIETQILTSTASANAIAVPYGSFTRINDAGMVNLTAAQSNPLLQTESAGANSLIPKTSTNGWYVIEAFRYGKTFGGSGNAHPATLMKPDPARSIVYRITSVVIGSKPGTAVVLKSIFVPYPAIQSP
jgi:type IV pilus assembly protein PilX